MSSIKISFGFFNNKEVRAVRNEEKSIVNLISNYREKQSVAIY